MTAVTGETGAGKTLVVEAIELLMGGRADATMVRHGADEAVVEGRFVVGDDEVVLRRVVPAEGRSRAYVDGAWPPPARWPSCGRRLVDLHGQHDHQSLLSPAVQRAALDRFGGVDLEPLLAARARSWPRRRQLADLGGDSGRGPARSTCCASRSTSSTPPSSTDPDEDELLAREEDRLADALAHQEAAGRRLARARRRRRRRSAGLARALAALDGRRRSTDQRPGCGAGRRADRPGQHACGPPGEAIEDDPERLDAVRSAGASCHELRRKYGENLAEVMAYRARRAARLDGAARTATAWPPSSTSAGRGAGRGAGAEHAVGAARRAAAPRLAAATQAHLVELAMPKARVEVAVGDDPGDDVTFLLAANPGSPPLPLAKVASGGELARTMLALRLVLSEAPPTLVFDEVDAGIGGRRPPPWAGRWPPWRGDHQVLVVTHLPQVAAFADAAGGDHQARRGRGPP